MDDFSLSNGDMIQMALCPICSSGSVLAAQGIRTINPKSDLVVELRECVNCLHWWHNPMPKQTFLNRLYRTASPFVVSQGWGKVIDEKQPLDRFGRLVVNGNGPGTPLNILEVGTGTGVLFRHMQRLGHFCHGIDPGNWCKTSGIFASMQQLPDESRYDVVVLQDVLEHLASPLEMMGACRIRAKTGARIYCAFPSRDSWLARHERKRWRMIRPLGHLHYFSRKSLELLFKRSGWSVSRVDAIRAGYALDLLRTRQLAGVFAHLLFGRDQWSVQGVRI